MKKGIYIRSLIDYCDNEIEKTDVDIIVVGNYGCARASPSFEQCISTSKKLQKKKRLLHYISPKLSEAAFENEFKKVLSLLNDNISVSINDWGLVYRLKPYIKMEHNLYIGRLLTTSFANLVWDEVFLRNESEQAKQYLWQNNMNDKNKIDLLNNYSIKGIEVDAVNKIENSCRRIREMGLQIIGYTKDTLLSVSRSCPIKRYFGEHDANCKTLCCNKYIIKPTGQKSRNIYPEMYLQGNVLYQVRENDDLYDFYTLVVNENYTKNRKESI